MTPRDTTAESLEYLRELTSRAFNREGFGTLCAFLRVDGMSDAYWDPFEESRKTFDDFNWVLAQSAQHRGELAERRVALLMYCQAIEMSAAHDMLVNLMRVASGQPYIIAPLRHLRRSKGRASFESIPPSARRKFEEIRKIATDSGEAKLCDLLDSFLDEDIRNAFSHSDYIFGENVFRWTEGGRARDIPLEELDRLISNCFGFYNALLGLQNYWLTSLAKGRRFHKWPPHEVLELLSSEDDGVYGFNVHFSNGSKATFTRRASGVEAINLSFGRNGEVEFFVGSLDDLESVYKVNGVAVDDWDALEEP